MTQTLLKTPPSTSVDSLVSARDVIKVEINGLEQLAHSLDDSFEAAVDLINGITGRVIVTGMGKSGHVGRKIASTLASVGQPAHFVHPAEASHGDLGMICPQDVLLALSYRGETSELVPLLTYLKRFQIPLISMTAIPHSTLARLSTVVLRLPAAEEACPLGLAPTTSSTMMMALGDALAITLLRCRGFTTQDFRTFHPGGSLGHQLTRVGDCMHTGDALPLLGIEAPMSDVLLEMSRKGFGCVGLLDSDGLFAGMITDGDLRRHMNPQLLQQTAESVMTRAPLVLTESMLMADALALLNKHQKTNIFVLRDLKPCGLLHIHDFLRLGVA